MEHPAENHVRRVAVRGVPLMLPPGPPNEPGLAVAQSGLRVDPCRLEGCSKGLCEVHALTRLEGEEDDHLIFGRRLHELDCFSRVALRLAPEFLGDRLAPSCGAYLLHADIAVVLK